MDSVIEPGKAKLYIKIKLASFSYYRGIKRDPEFWEAPVPRAAPIFSSECDCMMDLDKPQRLANFEVVSFSRWKNIKEGLQNFRELP